MKTRALRVKWFKSGPDSATNLDPGQVVGIIDEGISRPKAISLSSVIRSYLVKSQTLGCLHSSLERSLL